jgi:hypothetical protein
LRGHIPVVDVSLLTLGCLHCGVLSTDLRLVKCRLFDFFAEGFGDGGFLEDTVLAVEKPVLEGEFGEGEAYDEALPWEEWPVEPAAQALLMLLVVMLH